jgi:hypothetical protein
MQRPVFFEVVEITVRHGFRQIGDAAPGILFGPDENRFKSFSLREIDPNGITMRMTSGDHAASPEASCKERVVPVKSFPT